MIFNLFLTIYVLKKRDLLSLYDIITTSKASEKIKVVKKYSVVNFSLFKKWSLNFLT